MSDYLKDKLGVDVVEIIELSETLTVLDLLKLLRAIIEQLENGDVVVSNHVIYPDEIGLDSLVFYELTSRMIEKLTETQDL